MDPYRNVPPGQPLVIDTETTGLDWKTCQTVGFVLTTGPAPEDSWYLPIRHGGGGNLDPEKTIAYVKDVVRSASRVVGHSLKFDLHFLANDGIYLNSPAECTQVNGGLIDENYPSFSLQYLSEINGVQAKKGQPMYEHLASMFGGKPERNQMGSFWKTAGDDPIAVDYAVGDGTSTWQLWQKQQTVLDEQELRRVWAMECRLLPVLFRCERTGVRVHEERLRWLKKYLLKRLDEARRYLPDGFNVGAPTEIRRLLEKHGILDWPMTAPTARYPDGQPSFAEQWLMTFPLGEKIVRVRKIEGMMSRFIDPLSSTHLHKGRVHTTFNQLKMDDFGTMARLSSSAPNMQQIPKRDKVYAPPFRSVFIPDDGMLWSSNDFSQQEYRVFADYTKAKLLIEGYNAVPFRDIHVVVAELLGVERDPTAKRMNMGMLNSMGRQKLADTLGCDLQQAVSYLNKYRQMLPEVKRFNDVARRRAEDRGFVFTKLGRRARFPVRDWTSKAPSRIIQGTSADMTKLKMVEIAERFQDRGLDVLLQIHDDITWQFPIGDPGLNEEALAVMQSFGPDDEIQFDVPMIAESGVASDWGRASFPKFDWSALEDMP